VRGARGKRVVWSGEEEGGKEDPEPEGEGGDKREWRGMSPVG
jgi:hypothetical protein